MSGGEKKRVTVGEGLITNARFLALDEISTGLDSAVTYAIVASLRKRAEENGLGVVISMLQPTPETVALFNDVILLREGGVVYHGPVHSLPDYLRSCGYEPPNFNGQEDNDGSYDGSFNKSLEIMPLSHKIGDDNKPPVDVNGEPLDLFRSADLADWVMDLLSNPVKTHLKDVRIVHGLEKEHEVREKIVEKFTGHSSGSLTPVGSNPNISVSPSDTIVTAISGLPPLTTEDMMQAWQNSTFFKDQMSAPPSTPKLKLSHPYAIAQYGYSHVHSIAKHTALMVKRQFLLMRRNTLFIRSRLLTAIVMSIILGGLYYKLDDSEALTYMGTFLNSVMMMGFTNFSEMTNAVEYKYISYRHVANGSYPSTTLPIAAFITHIPVAIIETLIFTGILFGMTGMHAGLSTSDQAAGYFFYFMIVLLINISFSLMIRSFSFIGRTLQIAQSFPMPLIAILILFAGFMIAPNKMGWLKFVYYIDVLAYALKALMQKEFLSGRYDARPDGPGTPTLGEKYLQAFGQPTDKIWMGAGVIFIVGSLLLLLLCSILSFHIFRFSNNIGATREKMDLTGIINTSVSISDSEVTTPETSPRKLGGSNEDSPGPGPSPSPTGKTSVASALPFEPMTIAFKNIRYTVELGKHMGGGSKTLLHDISGYALPGRMIALMGASGAGKTTLLDVLASRKNSGKMEGSIFLNGHPKNDATFQRVTAYIEQQDILLASATVRESLEFSAKLRLPDSVTDEQRDAFVNETLDLLELTDIQNKLVGIVGQSGSLAPGERKRLTIGVEMCANAPILFLDEPTSGLDARAAATVMKVVKRIASTGRTIICTIHQPSADLFYQFDDLLLLQRGGYLTYFGPLGRQGRTVREYLQKIPGISPCPPAMNVASWMLDSLAGLNSSKKAGDAAKESVPPKVVDPTNPDAPEVVVEQTATFIDGEFLRDCWTESKEFQHFQEKIEVNTNPKATEAKIVKFSYGRSYPQQLWILLQRTYYANLRNVGLHFGRLVALTFLTILFGIIWFDIYNQSNDQAGVQSLVACIFMGAAFVAMIFLNTILPQLFQKRAVFYREQSSQMYAPWLHALSDFLLELPWAAFCVLVVTPIGYFMFRLRDDAEVFFFHYAVTLVLSVVYSTLGQFIAATLPTMDVAQAVVGLLAPLFFLFGGMWSPPSQMVAGARWFCYLDPITYGFRAMIPQQFFCEGPDCRTLEQVTPDGTVTKGVYDYVASLYEVNEYDKLDNLGYLAIFIVVFLFFDLVATTFVRHIVR